jgi:hypothetical protein
MSSTGEPITRCPVCRYDLTGLPAKHRCPECGFIYDATTRIWRYADPLLPAALGGASCVVPLGASSLSKINPAMQLGSWDWTLFLVPVAFLLYWFALTIEVPRNAFVAVSNFGLTFRKPFGRVQSARWSEIQVAPRFGRVFRVLGTTRSKLSIFRYGLGDRVRDAPSLLEAIKARARVLDTEDVRAE